MVDNAGEDQRAADVEQGDPSRPFEGVRFAVGGAKRHEAGHIEGARKVPFSHHPASSPDV